jgi:hypothetical protein
MKGNSFFYELFRLEKKVIYLGGREEKNGIEFAFECPKCRVIFHKEQLG